MHSLEYTLAVDGGRVEGKVRGALFFGGVIEASLLLLGASRVEVAEDVEVEEVSFRKKSRTRDGM